MLKPVMKSRLTRRRKQAWIGRRLARKSGGYPAVVETSAGRNQCAHRGGSRAAFQREEAVHRQRAPCWDVQDTELPQRALHVGVARHRDPARTRVGNLEVLETRRRGSGCEEAE